MSALTAKGTLKGLTDPRRELLEKVKAQGNKIYINKAGFAMIGNRRLNQKAFQSSLDLGYITTTHEGYRLTAGGEIVLEVQKSRSGSAGR